MIYLDTSVLLAYYCAEELSEQAEAVVLLTSQPAISWLCRVEFASGLARKIREDQLRKPIAQRALSLFESHIQAELYQVLVLTDRHYEQATKWLRQFDTTLRTLDALHLAVAHESLATIITADSKLATVAGLLGIQCQKLTANTKPLSE